MVYFTDITTSRQSFLVILDNNKQDVESGTRLQVHKPLIGHIVNDWPKFTNPLHRTTWTNEIPITKTSTAWKLESTHHRPDKETTPLLTLGRRIAERIAKWGDDMKFLGEFHYFKGYWEWTEDVLSRHEGKLRSAGLYDAVFASLFTYDRSTELMKAFCESWCPSTNTLLTSSGEMSISLWDLHVLSGLPANGLLFDDVVPCTKELIGHYRMEKHRSERPYLPRSCRYLFHAFHLVASSGRRASSCIVTIEEWIKFWSQKGLRYEPPPPRKETKARPKSTYNPTGEIRAHGAWTALEIKMFTRLEVPERHWDETALAAYLACWLCAFVFSDGSDLIKPNTFKMASRMAAGDEVVLTVPVLASIFRGLNNISNSVEPSRLRHSFPIHFVYGWLAHYFKTHHLLQQNLRVPSMIQYSGEGYAKQVDSASARQRIRKYEQIAWSCTMFTKDEDIAFSDNNSSMESHQLFFMALRSCYLPRRLDDHFIIEPYSPHRFSRQFGYYQVMPGVLSKKIQRVSLEDGVKYFRACIILGTELKVFFPRLLPSAKKFQTSEYKDWWAEVYKKSFEENIRTPLEHEVIVASGRRDQDVQIGPYDGKRRTSDVSLHDSDSNKVERHWKRTKPIRPESVEVHDESDCHESTPSARKIIEDVLGLTDTDDDESSQGSHVSVVPNHLSETHCLAKKTSVKPIFNSGAVSHFNSQSMINDELRLCLKKIWGNLRDKIARTPIDHVSSLEQEIRSGFSTLKGLPHDFDLTYLEDDINTLFAAATAYDTARSLSRECGEDSAQRLRDIKAALRDALAKEKEEDDYIKPIKKELADLEIRKDELMKSLEEHQALLRVIQQDVKNHEEEIENVKNAPPLDGKVLEELKNSEYQLQCAQRSLEDQNPFA